MSQVKADEVKQNTVIATKDTSVLVYMSEKYGMLPSAFEATLRATVMPADKPVSREQFAAFLLVAKEYDLNPVTKEIYAFPGKNGSIQPIVSIDGWLRMINQNPQMNGMEFKDTVDAQGNLTAVTCRIFRKDREHPTEVTEYMRECVRTTEPWQKWPARMLRHKATIQAGRYAFGLSGIYDQDEIERMSDVTTVAGTKTEQVLEQLRDPEPQAQQPVVVEGESKDVTDQEIEKDVENKIALAKTTDELDEALSMISSVKNEKARAALMQHVITRRAFLANQK